MGLLQWKPVALTRDGYHHAAGRVRCFLMIQTISCPIPTLASNARTALNIAVVANAFIRKASTLALLLAGNVTVLINVRSYLLLIS